MVPLLCHARDSCSVMTDGDHNACCSLSLDSQVLCEGHLIEELTAIKVATEGSRKVAETVVICNNLWG